jgi:hypothetical protein
MPRNQRSSSPIKRPEPIRTATPAAPIRSTFGQTIKEGLAFGIGSSVARNMVDSFMQPRAIAKPTEIAKPTPIHYTKMTEFKACMEWKNDYEECKIHLE